MVTGTVVTNYVHLVEQPTVSFRFDTLRLSQAQLVVGVLAVIAACVIFNKQYKLGREQMNLSEWQFELDVIRYGVDNTIQNKVEIITQTNMAYNMAKDAKLEGNHEQAAKHMAIARSNDEMIPILQKRITSLIEKYHKVLSRHPNKFKIEDYEVPEQTE